MEGRREEEEGGGRRANFINDEKLVEQRQTGEASISMRSKPPRVETQTGHDNKKKNISGTRKHKINTNRQTQSQSDVNLHLKRKEK